MQAIRRRKPGLFGSTAPSPTPGIGDDVERQRGGTIEQMPAGLGMQLSQPKRRSILPYAFAAIEDTLSRQMGYQPQGVARLNEMQQMQQRQAAQMAAEQRKRSTELADWKWKQDYTNANKPPEGPSTYEDNAGNRWIYDPATGRTIGDKPVWVDPTERVIYQDGMQIRVPNPYRSGGSSAGNLPTVSDQASYDAVPAGGQYRDAQGNVRTKQGGPTQPASGGF